MNIVNISSEETNLVYVYYPHHIVFFIYLYYFEQVRRLHSDHVRCTYKLYKYNVHKA